MDKSPPVGWWWFFAGQESPVWYVEPCGGEGEYHVGRLRDSYEGQPMKWPKAEEIWGENREDLTGNFEDLK